MMILGVQFSISFYVILFIMRKKGQLSVSLQDISENEFLQGGGNGMSRAFSRDIRIKKLEERNVKLQEQVIKIERALSGMDMKVTYGIRLPEIKSDVIRKELQNAYKMVKQYQYQINKIKRLDVEGAYVQQLRKLEGVLKQKQLLSQKLRREVGEVKKQSVEYVRMLKNDSLRQEQIEKEKTTNADIKWIHEKIKVVQAKRATLSSNLEKQKELIQKIEKDLVSKYNYDKNQIENMRNKIFNATLQQFAPNEPDSDQELEPPEARDDIFLQNRNQETYNLFMNEVKLYRKLEKDYEGKIQLLTKEKEEAEERNFASRNKLVQVQYQIQRVQARIKELKGDLDPRALIPTKLDMILQEKRRHSSSVKINKPKITMAHLYKFNQVGEGTKNGKRFIDRPTIGKKIAKIVGVTFFERKDGQHELLGIQAVYLIQNSKKEGPKNILADLNNVETKTSSLQQGDYVKTVDCFFNEKGVIIGTSMVSARNAILKGGATSAIRKTIEMQPQEYPICLYGCLLIDGIEMLGVELSKDE